MPLRQITNVKIHYWPWDRRSDGARLLYDYLMAPKRRVQNLKCTFEFRQNTSENDERLAVVTFSDGKYMSFEPSTKSIAMLAAIKRYAALLQTEAEMKLGG